MAKIVIVGNAVVVTSSLKFDDIVTVAKYRPEALILRDEEKHDIFRIEAVVKSVESDEDTPTGFLNSYGAEFCGKTRDDDGLATLTMSIGNEQNIKDVVAETLGTAIIRLNELENQVAEVIGEINADISAVYDSIEVVQ